MASDHQTQTVHDADADTPRTRRDTVEDVLGVQSGIRCPKCSTNINGLTEIQRDGRARVIPCNHMVTAEVTLS